MLTLETLRKTPAADLLKLAAETDNRQYSIALTQLAHAQYAFQIGDKASMAAHWKRCQTAYARAQEDEHGQLRRVAHVQAVVEEKGAALSSEGIGKHVVKIRAQRGGAIWGDDWAKVGR